MSEPQKPEAGPGDGLRSVRTTTLFRVVNYELYAKPVSLIILTFFQFLFIFN